MDVAPSAEQPANTASAEKQMARIFMAVISSLENDNRTRNARTAFNQQMCTSH